MFSWAAPRAAPLQVRVFGAHQASNWCRRRVRGYALQHRREDLGDELQSPGTCVDELPRREQQGSSPFESPKLSRNHVSPKLTESTPPSSGHVISLQHRRVLDRYGSDQHGHEIPVAQLRFPLELVTDGADPLKDEGSLRRSQRTRPVERR